MQGWCLYCSVGGGSSTSSSTALRPEWRWARRWAKLLAHSTEDSAPPRLEIFEDGPPGAGEGGVSPAVMAHLDLDRARLQAWDAKRMPGAARKFLRAPDSDTCLVRTRTHDSISQVDPAPESETSQEHGGRVLRVLLGDRVCYLNFGSASADWAQQLNKAFVAFYCQPERRLKGEEAARLLDGKNEDFSGDDEVVFSEAVAFAAIREGRHRSPSRPGGQEAPQQDSGKNVQLLLSKAKKLIVAVDGTRGPHFAPRAVWRITLGKNCRAAVVGQRASGIKVRCSIPCEVDHEGVDAHASRELSLNFGSVAAAESFVDMFFRVVLAGDERGEDHDVDVDPTDVASGSSCAALPEHHESPSAAMEQLFCSCSVAADDSSVSTRVFHSLSTRTVPLEIWSLCERLTVGPRQRLIAQFRHYRGTTSTALESSLTSTDQFFDEYLVECTVVLDAVFCTGVNYNVVGSEGGEMEEPLSATRTCAAAVIEEHDQLHSALSATCAAVAVALWHVYWREEIAQLLDAEDTFLRQLSHSVRSAVDHVSGRLFPSSSGGPTTSRAAGQRTPPKNGNQPGSHFWEEFFLVPDAVWRRAPGLRCGPGVCCAEEREDHARGGAVGPWQLWREILLPTAREFLHCHSTTSTAPLIITLSAFEAEGGVLAAAARSQQKAVSVDQSETAALLSLHDPIQTLACLQKRLDGIIQNLQVVEGDAEEVEFCNEDSVQDDEFCSNGAALLVPDGPSREMTKRSSLEEFIAEAFVCDHGSRRAPAASTTQDYSQPEANISTPRRKIHLVDGLTRSTTLSSEVGVGGPSETTTFSLVSPRIAVSPRII